MGSDDRIHDHEAQTLPPSLLLKLSRRRFLEIGALMAASLALPGCRPSTTPGSTPAFPSLTIVPLLTPALQPTKTADNTLPPATVPFGQSNSSTDSPTAAPQTPAPPGITPDTNPSVSSSPQPERQRPRWGYFTGGPDIAEEVQTVQDAIGAVPDFLTTFVGWHGEGQIPEAVIETARAHKQTVIVFWEVYTPGVFPSEDSAFSCNEILSGRYDEYLEQFAQTAGRAGVPILLIPFPEPNGKWTPQCVVTNGNTAESFRSAFKHTASFFENSPNIRVGLAMNSNSVPDPVTAPENTIAQYVLESGAEFIGIDGFNFGPPQAPWLSAEAILGPAVAEIEELKIEGIAEKIMVTSFGCALGEARGVWIEEALAYFRTHGAGFDFSYFGENKAGQSDWERDWGILNDPNALKAFRDGVV